MVLKQLVYSYRYPLALLLVLTLGVSSSFGIASSESLLAGLLVGILAGFTPFVIISLIFVALVLSTRRHIRLLRATFFGLVLVGIVGNLLGGRSLADAVGFGIVTAGLSFIPVMTLFALVFVVYVASKDRAQSLQNT